MQPWTRIAGIALGVAAIGATAPARACPPAPLSACRLAGKNALRIADSSDETANDFSWSWVRGPGTAAEFGDPTGSTAFALCVYDATGLVAALDVSAAGTCAGRPCWRATNKGFKYRDGSGQAGGVRRMTLAGGTTAGARVRVSGRAVALPDHGLPLSAPLTVQLTRSDGGVCFESVFDTSVITRDDAGLLRARATVKATTPMPALPSAGCGTPLGAYMPGVSTADTLVHDGLTRTFRVYVPPSYDASGGTPTPVFLLLHGGFGSGAQVEGSSRLLEVADANGFIVVSPDGVASPGGVRAWNGGGCCGYSVATGVDDVGFIGALLDRLEANLCVDRRRAYAAGMSNGAILSHRLACDLAGRIRAVGSVAGAMMADPCTPARPVPVMEIHGTGDLNIPFGGGMGCGAAGVPFPSVADTVGAWVARDACNGLVTTLLQQGDGICELAGTCTVGTDVALCTIPDGGHQWPGGTPPLVGGLPGCPFGYQSQTFSASQVLWQFFSQHPPR